MPIINLQMVFDLSESQMDRMVQLARDLGHDYDRCNDRDLIVKRLFRSKVQHLIWQIEEQGDSDVLENPPAQTESDSGSTTGEST